MNAYELGATLLLFSIGVQFSLSELVGQGLKALFGATIIMGSLFVVGYEASILIGLDFFASLAIGASFAFSSTAIFIRLMESYGLLHSPQVPFLVSVLVIEDIVAVFAIAFFSSLARQTTDVNLDLIMMSLLLSLAIMGFAYLILNRLTPRVFKFFIKDKISSEYIVLLSLTFALILAFFSTALGLSASVGAFIAGSILSNSPLKQKVHNVVSPLTLAFSSYFFISIGLLVSPSALFSSLPILFLLTITFIVVSFLSTGISTYLMGFKSYDAITAGFSMAVMGEFSLLVAKEVGSSISNFDVVSMFSAIVFLTTLFSSILLSQKTFLQSTLLRLIPSQLSYSAGLLQNYILGIFSRFNSSASCVSKARSSLFIITRNATIFTVVTVCAFFVRAYIHKYYFHYGIFEQIVGVFPFLSLLLLTPLLISILFELAKFANSVTDIFIPDGIRKANGILTKLLLSLGLFILLFASFILIPATVESLQLPQFMNYITIFPLLGMILIVWNGFLAIASFLPSRILKNTK